MLLLENISQLEHNLTYLCLKVTTDRNISQLGTMVAMVSHQLWCLSTCWCSDSVCQSSWCCTVFWHTPIQKPPLLNFLWKQSDDGLCIIDWKWLLHQAAAAESQNRVTGVSFQSPYWWHFGDLISKMKAEDLVSKHKAKVHT